MTISLDDTPPKKGWGKWSAAGIGLEVAIRLHPPISSYLQAQFGFGAAGAEELTTEILSLMGAFGVWMTPSNFVEFVTDSILFWRRAFKTWNDARKNPLT